jgi:hypothetical protein
MNDRNWENVNLIHRALSIDAGGALRNLRENLSKRITAVDNAMTAA